MATRTLKATAVTSMSALALAAASQASAFEFQAGDTDVSIYGYVTGKVAYDVDADLGSATGLDINNVADQDPSGYFDFDASESRLGVETTTNTGGGDVTTVLEGDFVGGTFRLRHAYGTFGGVLAGQTWSNFNSFVGFTPTLDFNSSAGAAGLQDFTSQVRYTTGGLSVAVEQPRTQVGAFTPDQDGDLEFDGPGTKNSLPAFTARYEGSEGPLGYSVAGIVRQIELASEDDDAIGFGALVAMSYDLGMVTLRGNLGYKDGANSYLYHSGVNFFGTDAYIDDGDLETVSGYGGTIGASFDAGPGTVNVVYGRTQQDDTEFTGDNEMQQSLFANYMWYPADNLMYGVEAGYVQKETADNADQDDPDGTRVSFAAQYSF